MEQIETARRRRITICDGTARYEIAAPADTTVDAVLRHVGIDAGRVWVRDQDGAEVESTQALRDCDDGDVLTIVDDSRVAPRTGRRHGDHDSSASAGHVSMMLGVFAIVVVVLVSSATRMPAPLSIWLAVIMAAGACVAGVGWARRGTGAGDTAADGSFAPLALAAASGLLLSPALAWGSVHVAVICAAAFVAVLAGILALVAGDRAASAGLLTVAVLSAALAMLWALVLIASLPAAAACAVTLGLAPLVLRVLPSTALSARPGMFIDFARFQTLRWSAREREPEPAHAISAAQARTMVAQSGARWRSGAAFVCVAVAISSPFALVPLDADNLLVRIGQIALAVCVIIALTLQSRRAPRGLLRWMPRAVVLVILLSTALAAGGLVGMSTVGVGVGVFLFAAIIAAVMIVPVGRGVRSLRWSRVGDFFEAVAIAFALPAGLLAASVVDLLRGMMAS